MVLYLEDSLMFARGNECQRVCSVSNYKVKRTDRELYHQLSVGAEGAGRCERCVLCVSLCSPVFT